MCAMQIMVQYTSVRVAVGSRRKSTSEGGLLSNFGEEAAFSSSSSAEEVCYVLM